MFFVRSQLNGMHNCDTLCPFRVLSQRDLSQYHFALYLSVSTRGVIGQFCEPYFTVSVRPAKFESFLSRASN